VLEILEDLKLDDEGNYIINKNTGEIKGNDWKQKKEQNILLVESYQRLGMENRAKKTKNCGSYLEFTKYKNGQKKLTQAYFCKDRLCGMCNWRKSNKMRGQLTQIIEEIKERDPKLKYLFLTLTIKNCSGDDLGKTITKLIEGQRKLLKYKKVNNNLVGTFRALEITVAKDGKYHPHLHLLLAVEPSYFYRKGKNYIAQKEWSLLWQKALKVDYIPVVDIKRAKGNNGVVEVAKYTVKATDYINANNKALTDERVIVLSKALKGRRLLSYTGIFKEIKKELMLVDIEDKDVDLIGAGENKQEDEGIKEVYVWYLGFNPICNKKEFNYYKRKT